MTRPAPSGGGPGLDRVCSVVWWWVRANAGSAGLRPALLTLGGGSTSAGPPFLCLIVRFICRNLPQFEVNYLSFRIILPNLLQSRSIAFNRNSKTFSCNLRKRIENVAVMCYNYYKYCLVVGMSMAKKVHSPRSKPEQRHYNMSRIRSNNTKIEVRLRKALWHLGIRYRINYSALPGKPDIAITKYKIAIFCDGEFWHGKDWKIKKQRINSNRDYWLPKIEKNILRDSEVDKELFALGWRVLRFWGADIQKNLEDCVSDVQATILESIVQSCEIKIDTDETTFELSGKEFDY